MDDKMKKTNTKKARLKLGLSQSEMAGICSAGTGTVQKWDNGQRSPRGPARRLIELWLRLKDNHPEVYSALIDHFKS